MFTRHSARNAVAAQAASAPRRSPVWRCAACALLTGSEVPASQPEACAECGGRGFWRVAERRRALRSPAHVT